MSESYFEIEMKLRNLGEPLPAPRLGDWLAEHPESGAFLQRRGTKNAENKFRGDCNSGSLYSIISRARGRHAPRDEARIPRESVVRNRYKLDQL